MGSRTLTKHKLLLDEGLPRKESYPLLNNYFNLRHIVHEFGKKGHLISITNSITSIIKSYGQR